MKSDWEKKTWGDLITLEYGKSLKGYKKGDGQYQVFGTNGPIGWSDKFLYDKPSIIIGRKGAYRGVHFSKDPFFVIDTAFYVKPKEKFNMLWAYYQMSTIDIDGMDSGSAIPSTSRDEFYQIPVKVPPLDEQKAIASFLKAYDQKIQLNRQTNETLEGLAHAIFKSWFVDFDPLLAKIRAKQKDYNPKHAAMAAITGVSFDQSWEEIDEVLEQKLSNMTEAQREELQQNANLFPDVLEDSESGEIPKGWGIKPLDEIADYLNGRAMQKYPPEEGKDVLPVLKIAQLRKGDTSDADVASADIPERFKVYNGDMIFSWSGSLLIDLWCGGDAALNQHLFKVTSEEYPKWFYYFWTKHHLDNFIRIAEAKAVTMGHIKRSHLAEAKCVIPSTELLEIGGKIIGPLLDKLVQLRLESKTLEELRDTLLPKLISGEVKV